MVITQSAFHKVFEGAPVTRPVGVLDIYIYPAPPKGSAVLDQKPNPSGMLTIVKLQAIRGVSPAPSVSIFCCNLDQLGSMLVQVGRLVGHARPSCPTWFLLGSNLVHLCSNLAQLSANLAQLGPILAQLGSNLVQFWSQLGPTWTQNLTKMSFKRCFLASPSDLQFSIDFSSHVGSIFSGFCKAAMSQKYKKPIVFLGF